MTQSSLNSLHLQFNQALKTHTYLGPTEEDPAKLEQTATKDIRLQEVYQKARQQIETSLKEQSGQLSDLEKEISVLRALDKDGKIYYQRYTASTNTWSRWFLKGVAYYTPTYLKRFLPTCFSNGMAQAEKQTQQEYEKYKKCLRDNIIKLMRMKGVAKNQPAAGEKSPILAPLGEDEVLDPDRDDLPLDKNPSSGPAKKFNKKLSDKELKESQPKSVGFNEEEDPELQKFLMQPYDSQKPDEKQSPAVKKSDSTKLVGANPPLKPEKVEGVVTPSKEEGEKQRQQTIQKNLETIQTRLQLLNQFDQRPCSIHSYKQTLGILFQQMSSLFLADADNAPQALEKLGLSKEVIQVLRDRQLCAVLGVNDNQKIADLLKTTSWHASFTEAMNQQGHVKFGIRRMAGSDIVMLTNEQGTRLQEKDFQKYRGKIQITLVDGKNLNELNECVKFLEKNPTCRPYALELNLKDDLTLTPELFAVLLTLREKISEIQMTGVKELNFKNLHVSAEQEFLFVQHFPQFSFPHLENIVLSTHPKEKWTALHFSTLLAFVPKMDLLKECYHVCSTPQEIVIPEALSNQTEWDARGYSVDHVTLLLKQFPSVTHLNLSGLQISDAQLTEWIKQGHLKTVTTLQLDSCSALTTDILPALAKLPHLAQLSLPDLAQGKLALDQLPKFDNPFKINLLYTTSKVTQKMASQLYTGPLTWAPVFQIPLARQGVADIFTDQHKVLDPKSVAYWLYNNDYQNIPSNNKILTILADSNAALTDKNIIEFVKKLPYASALSLYNCPHVTDKGIIDLLKACPKIRTLDLMGCPHITESLFFGDGNFDILNTLDQLIITDTGITDDIADTMKLQMNHKLSFEKTTLKITDDQLVDDNALEEILKAKKLNKLKRIDLEGCTKLTNQMLGQLLDRLNIDEEIKVNDKTQENPQRLNLAVLNLTGCSNITNEAFDQKQEGGKITPKLLENLDRIVMSGTKISNVLKGVYPQVVFQEFDEPVTLEINPDVQLQACVDYYQGKQQVTDGKQQDSSNVPRLSSSFVHDRIITTLFGSDCQKQELVKQVLSQAVDTNSQEFSDFSLYFKTDDQADPSIIHAHRDVLYCQSLYFINRFRPGGILSKLSALDLINLHATPKSVQVIRELLYGQAHIDNLDWETAAHVAELVGPQNLNLMKSFYTELLNRIHSQFDLSRAEKMFMSATLLKDTQGIQQYEQTLLLYLEDPGLVDNHLTEFQTIVNIAKNYQLPNLLAKVTKIQKEQTEKIIQQQIAEQNIQNERLVASMVAANQFADLV